MRIPYPAAAQPLYFGIDLPEFIDAGHFTWEDSADEYAALVTVRQAALANQVTLYKALGGGWQPQTTEAHTAFP
jgi:hypothetical protein